MKLRVFIADDEPPARSKVRKFLEGRNDIEIAGEAGDGIAAIRGILELRPELVFLDIQMPKGDGFEVLREVFGRYKPAVIFTTAYDQYAIRAFEVEAMDYLLKPFTADRFHAALDRAVRERRSQADAADRIAALLQRLSPVDPRGHRILVRKDDRLFFVRASDIEWIEAEEKYVILHTRSERHILRESMAVLEGRLSATGFVRIHRSHLVNLDALKEVVTLGRGDCVAVLKSGGQLSVGRNYKDKLLESMGRGSQE
jgi:two-component system LytT family response regulator